jgi:Rieske Fe-S protein
VTQQTPELPRRTFSKFVVPAILAAIPASLWLLRLWYRSRPNSPRVIAHADEIPVGDSKIFQYPGVNDPCFLIRPAADRYLAYSRLCTHNSCPVFYHPDENVFACNCHGGVFSITDGSVLQGPPPRPLPRILLEFRGTEILAIGIARE